jgi:NADH-quinone oxidoreductase subunit C
VTEAEIQARVVERFGARVLSTYAFRGQHAVTIEPAALPEVLAFLRDSPDLDMAWLMDIGGVDYLGYEPDVAGSEVAGSEGDDGRDWRFEVAYQLYSTSKNHRFRVKVAVKDDSVEVPSAWPAWGIANWMEREVFDLFGIRFTGHPNLRRILCHDDFEGHALRKDYPINKRQVLSEPSERILCERSELA